MDKVKHKKPMVLVDRDKQILHDISVFRVMTTEQVSVLHFQSVHRARKRLHLLCEHRLIVRHRRPVRMGEGSHQFVYTLTRRGLQAAMDRRLPSNHAGPQRGSLGEHAIHLNDFRTAIVAAGRRSYEFALGPWQPDRVLKFTVPLASRKGRDAIRIVPDGFFVFTVRGRKFGYFVEIDCGNTDLNRIYEKFLGYSVLWKGDAATEIGIRSFRVLYVTTTEKRVEGLLTALTRLDGLHRRDIVSITSRESYSLQTPDVLFTSIWKTVDEFGAVRRVSPLPALHPSTLPTAPSNPLVRGPDAGAR